MSRIAQALGRPEIGVHVKAGPTRSGKATLRVCDDQDVQDLQPGDVVITMWPTGLIPLHVARCRLAVGGELEARIEVPVVDARLLDGRCLTWSPCDLLRVSVKGKVGAGERAA